MSGDPFRCCGCGQPLELGEYRSCDCATGVGFCRGSQEQVLKKSRCARCDAVPTRANLDGDDLCQACCEKWVLAEGFAQKGEVAWSMCTIPPEGWWCSRAAGHEGPCAARPINPYPDDELFEDSRDSGSDPKGEDP